METTGRTRRWRRGLWRVGAAVVLTLAMAPAVASAGTGYRYTGADGESWTDASNWSPSTGFPGQSPTDTAVIDNGQRPVLSQDLTIAALTLAGGGGRDGSGTLTVTGADRQTWGRALLRGTGTTILGSGTDVVLDGGLRLDGSATLVLAGTTVQTGSNAIEMGDGFPPDAATLDNRGITSLDGAGVQLATASSGRMLNSGTVQRTAPGRASVMPLSNTGEILATAGELWLHGGQSPTTGKVTADGPGLIGFIGGAYAAESGARIGGTGTIDVFTGTLSVPPGASFAPAALRLSGTDVNDGSAGLELGVDGTAGSLYMNGYGLRAGPGRLDVAGPSAVLNGRFGGSGVTDFAEALTVAQGGMRIADTAHVRLGAGGSMTANVSMPGDDPSDAPLLENAGGTLTVSGTAQVHYDGPVAASRVVNAPGAALVVPSGTPTSMVPIQNQGHISIDGAARLRALGGLTVSEPGSLAVAGVLEMGAAPLSLPGGSLGGTGTVEGSVANSGGAVGPGASPGTLTVTGDYAQGPDGTLRTEIEGTTPGSGYDQLRVGGNATLGGALAIAGDDSFDPPTDAVFDVLTATGGVSGQFATLTGQSTPSKEYGVRYTEGPPGKVTLEVAEVPADVTIADCDDPRLATLTEVRGDLTIDAGAGCGHLTMPLLAGVGGTLTVTGSLTAVDFEVLDTVGGDLDVSGASLTSADFGDLDSIGGTLDVSGGSLTAADFAELDDVGGGLEISGTSLTTADFAELDDVGGGLEISQNGTLTAADLSSLNTVGDGLDVSANGTLTDVALESLVSVGGDLRVETGQTHLDVSGAQVTGHTVLAGTGTQTVAAQTAGESTGVTLLSGIATMAALVPAGAFEGFVPFSVERLDPAATGAEDGRAADGGAATVDPVIAYRFAFSDPQLDAEATLDFTVDLSQLGDFDRQELLAALAEGRLTMAVKDDGGGTYQAFALCADGESPQTDGCVVVTRLDADGRPLAAESTDAPAAVRLEGATGHFSTWAVATVTRRNTPPEADDDVFAHHGTDTPLEAPAPGVLDGDSDADGDPLSAVLVDAPDHGTLDLSADGSFVYRPHETHPGGDSFTYRADDGADRSAAAVVTLRVSPGCGGKPATIVGTAGSDRLRGTAGIDVMAALAGDDRLYGSGGNDVLCAGPGDDQLNGDVGGDLLHGGSGDDALRGDAGDDHLFGWSGADVLLGDLGDDLLSGGAGTPDSCHTGEGADALGDDHGCEKINGVF